MCVFEGISDMGLTVCWGIHHFSLWYDILQQHILTRLVIPSLSTTQSSFSASLLTSECVQSTKINRETITWNFSAVYWSHRPKKNPFNIWSLITFTQARYNEIWSELRTSGIKHQHDTKSSSLCRDHNLMWVRWKVKWKPVTLLKMTMTNHKWNWHVWF